MLQFEKDLASQHRELFEQARNFLVIEHEFMEKRKPRITTYSNAHGGICHMRTMPHGIDFGFLKGSKMNDPEDLLQGSGKLVRVLPLAHFDTQNIRYFINQAVAINAAT